MAYSNFGSLSYVQLGMATAADSPLLCEAILAPAAKYNKTPAQVCLRWALQRNTVVIPKSVKQERLVENFSVFDFSLTDDEMSAISSLNKNERYNDPGVYAEKAFNCFYPIYE